MRRRSSQNANTARVSQTTGNPAENDESKQTGSNSKFLVIKKCWHFCLLSTGHLFPTTQDTAYYWLPDVFKITPHQDVGNIPKCSSLFNSQLPSEQKEAHSTRNSVSAASIAALHFFSQQCNCHVNYVIDTTLVDSYDSRCSSDQYPVKMYFYHGSIGFFAFYKELSGTYYVEDHTIYGQIDGLGTFDINGSFLANDNGGSGYRMSYWYAATGAIWIVYRGLVLRRSYIACHRYGRRCDQMGEQLDRKTTMVFVHESMRLSAHGATNYHRVLLLYLLVEGIMTDLFLLVATDGIFSWFQYISLGYNLSGVVLLVFEMIENMGWLRESTRLCIKRLLFSYESSFIGELLSDIGQPHFITSLSHSDLKHSGYVARAASYYVWGLVGHGVIVLPLIGFIMFVRVLRATTYMQWKHGSGWGIFTAPCSIDTTLGMLNKMMMLRAYEHINGKLYYNSNGLKSFGLLKMDEETGTEFLVLPRVHWFTVPSSELFVIGTVSQQHVESCNARPCLGVVSFLSPGAWEEILLKQDDNVHDFFMA